MNEEKKEPEALSVRVSEKINTKDIFGGVPPEKTDA